MKKWLLSVILVSGMIKFCHAGQDPWDSMRPAMWRASFSVTADGFGQLTSTGSYIFPGGYVLHAVVIDSPTFLPGTGSEIDFFNSTTTLGTLNPTTFTMVTTNAQLGTTPFQPLNTYIFDVVFTTGITYNKVGAAKTTILWDYLISRP